MAYIYQQIEGGLSNEQGNALLQVVREVEVDGEPSDLIGLRFKAHDDGVSPSDIGQTNWRDLPVRERTALYIREGKQVPLLSFTWRTFEHITVCSCSHYQSHSEEPVPHFCCHAKQTRACGHEARASTARLKLVEVPLYTSARRFNQILSVNDQDINLMRTPRAPQDSCQYVLRRRLHESAAISGHLSRMTPFSPYGTVTVELSDLGNLRWSLLRARIKLLCCRDYFEQFVVTGIGLFLEGWVIFSISNVSTLFKQASGDRDFEFHMSDLCIAFAPHNCTSCTEWSSLSWD